ncbi:MAG: DUF4380 domain-containing protein [Acidobacteriota bacterium]|nr:DUF4380 domain-containing protein [Acidobacteriota bacterium]
MEKIEYQGFPNCIRLNNNGLEIVATTDVGPRILFFGFHGGENILGFHPDAKVETPLGTWKPYGGHRLWIAPENMPLSYAPDNAPIEYFLDEANNSARLRALVEAATAMQKEIEIAPETQGFSIKHRITNLGENEIEFAPWALTIMRGGGEAVIPNEPFAPYSPETLLPVRSFAVWSYTDFTDSRWTFEKEFIRLKTDESLPNPQKIGVFNRRGWAAYEWRDLLFVKEFDVVLNAAHPDMNSNTEVYTAGGFVEVETLAPLQKVATGESAELIERWFLFEGKNAEDLRQIS